MKRIKNISHLEEEKSRLRIKQLELENRLFKNWAEIKQSVEPKKILQTAIRPEGSNKSSIGYWLLQGIHVATSALVSNALHNAEMQAEKRMDNAMQKASQFFFKKGRKMNFNSGTGETKN